MIMKNISVSSRCDEPRQPYIVISVSSPMAAPSLTGVCRAEAFRLLDLRQLRRGSSASWLPLASVVKLQPPDRRFCDCQNLPTKKMAVSPKSWLDR